MCLDKLSLVTSLTRNTDKEKEEEKEKEQVKEDLDVKVGDPEVSQPVVALGRMLLKSARLQYSNGRRTTSRPSG
jgi:hypothetical protein